MLIYFSPYNNYQTALESAGTEGATAAGVEFTHLLTQLALIPATVATGGAAAGYAVEKMAGLLGKVARAESTLGVGAKQAAAVAAGEGGGVKVAATALDELGQLPSLAGKTVSEIEYLLKSQGYTSVPAKNGGAIWTKNLPDGNTAAVRLDPPTVRDVPKGFADEIPHAHKEIVPTVNVENGNYKPNQSVTTLDDACCATTDPSKTHIPIQ